MLNLSTTFYRDFTDHYQFLIYDYMSRVSPENPITLTKRVLTNVLTKEDELNLAQRFYDGDTTLAFTMLCFCNHEVKYH